MRRPPQHRALAEGGWGRFSLLEQLGNAASEVGRAARWAGRDPQVSQRAFLRALELLDLTIADERWKGRRKELLRARESLCDAAAGGDRYGSTLEDMERYFHPFAGAARRRALKGRGGM